MLKTQKCVHEMMEALELPLPYEDTPGVKRINFSLLRSMVQEEAGEFDQAMSQLQVCLESGLYSAALKWWAEVIDAMCDIIVVVHNTSNAMGIDLEPFFDEVHRSNMAKVGGPVREDGKKLKPDGWQPPQVQKMLSTLLHERGVHLVR